MNISSKKQITKSLLIFVVPFIVFLISYNVFMINNLNEQLAETGRNLIHIYKNPMETEIASLQQSIVDVMANDSDFLQMIYADKTYEKYASLQKVAEKFQRIFSTNEATAGCIIYDAKTDLIQEIYTGGSTYSYADKESFKELLREYAQDEQLLREGWKIWEVGQSAYLIRVFCKSNIYMMGIYDLGRTQQPQKLAGNDPDAFLFFTDEMLYPLTSRDKMQEDGIILEEQEKTKYFISGSPVRYLIVQDDVGQLPLKVMYAAPYYGILKGSDIMPAVFMAVSLILVWLLWLSFRTLQEKYLKPFQKLVETMAVIKEGNMEARMSEETNIREFHVLADSFNEMMQEIKALKISSYEYQIEMQQAKLQYLQIQMRPHFFLNCLKNLYGLAEEGKSGQIQKTILVLSEHLRYMMRDNFLMLPMEAELQSVENYILLQQLTTTYRISCNIDVEEGLKKQEIPPLSILAFVENAIKHANLIHKPLKIQIRISSWEGEDGQFISITILDNGLGFSEESLRELNRNEDYEYDGTHVGIQNVRHRFALIYQDKVNFLFSNMTGSGACVQIIIPVSQKGGDIPPRI